MQPIFEKQRNRYSVEETSRYLEEQMSLNHGLTLVLDYRNTKTSAWYNVTQRNEPVGKMELMFQKTNIAFDIFIDEGKQGQGYGAAIFVAAGEHFVQKGIFFQTASVERGASSEGFWDKLADRHIAIKLPDPGDPGHFIYRYNTSEVKP
jgi:hypothetical protein